VTTSRNSLGESASSSSLTAVRGIFHGVPRATSAHSSRDFETELRELQAHLLAMGARCERVVGLAFGGFVRGAPETAGDVEALDVQIDRDELQIHALILRILALRQPVADDLRFLATALRLITDLERIGDEAVNIGERTVQHEGDAKQIVNSELASMAAAALDMLHGALDALVRWDDNAADRVLGCDDAVDQHFATILSAMTAHMSQHPSEVPAGLRVIRVAKYLERIADHATNVAEEVIFMVRADDVRHGQWQRGASLRGVGAVHAPSSAGSGPR
jgi:phosphate transport system protein